MTTPPCSPPDHRTTLRRTASVAVLALALLAAGQLPAQAASTTVADEVGDAPAKVDLDAVTYRNGDLAASALLSIPDLGRRGRAMLSVAPELTDMVFTATVRRNAKGKVRTSLTFSSGGGPAEAVDCRTKGAWRVKKGVVSVSVPRSCIDPRFTEAPERLDMWVATGGREGDQAAGVTLDHG